MFECYQQHFTYGINRSLLLAKLDESFLDRRRELGVGLRDEAPRTKLRRSGLVVLESPSTVSNRVANFDVEAEAELPSITTGLGAVRADVLGAHPASEVALGASDVRIAVVDILISTVAVGRLSKSILGLAETSAEEVERVIAVGCILEVESQLELVARVTNALEEPPIERRSVMRTTEELTGLVPESQTIPMVVALTPETSERLVAVATEQNAREHSGSLLAIDEFIALIKRSAEPLVGDPTLLRLALYALGRLDGELHVIDLSIGKSHTGHRRNSGNHHELFHCSFVSFCLFLLSCELSLLIRPELPG